MHSQKTHLLQIQNSLTNLSTFKKIKANQKIKLHKRLFHNVLLWSMTLKRVLFSMAILSLHII